jgi:putative protease
LADLINAGVTSFKIEGRLKDSNYVKNTVSHYRWRLDEAMASRKGHGRASHGRSIPDFVSDPSKSFMRGGGSEYFIDGRRKGVATLETPKAVGENMGTVAAAGKGWFGVEGTSKGEFTAGDGLCWMEGGELSGANVERVDAGRIFLNKPAVAPCGTALYRNHDHRFVAALTASRTRRVIGVEAHLRISAGRMELTVTDETGIEARSFHTGTFPRATDPDRALETMRAQISKSGETIFSVDSVAIKQEGEAPFVPVSILNALRREALNKLSKKRMTATLPRFAAEADPSARWPGGSVDATENVTNYLARRFYERHGARNVEDGLDLRGDLTGCTVMRTPYCVRREADLCGHDGNADLYLRRGALNYRLRFDCRDCIMEVIKI